MREKTKRIVGIIMAITLMLGASGVTVGAASASNKVLVYVKPSFTVEMNGTVYIFKDSKGQRVYPVVYNGRTYLPIRAVAALMEEDIEWDNKSETVYIGKTLSNPNKSQAKKDKNITSAAVALDTADLKNLNDSEDLSNLGNDETTDEKETTVIAYLKSNINIMLDFKIQKFQDAKGENLYPISYNESTYLPIQAVSLLMGEPVEWDNDTKTIKIGDKTLPEKKEETRAAVLQLKQEFESAIETYDQATSKIVNIKKTKETEALNILMNSINEDVVLSAKQLKEIKEMDTRNYTKEELAAHQALYDFVDVSQYYLLVLENIAYMAANGQDYSMLSETFLNFALDSQSKMNNARDLIEAL